MKKIATVILGIFCSLIIACGNTKQEEPFFPWIQKQIKTYKPLKKRRIDSDHFFDKQTVGNNQCSHEWSIHQWFTTYPDKRVLEKVLPLDSIPIFKQNYFDRKPSKNIIKPIVDSLYLNENYLNEFRMESTYPINLPTEINDQHQKIQLHTFIPENNKLYGLISEPQEAWGGARLEIIYNIIDFDKNQIFLDEDIPLSYKINKTDDSIRHTFSLGFKKAQFNDIYIGLVEVNFLPPKEFDFLRLTKDSIGKTTFFRSQPMILSAFQNGMIHLIMDKDLNFDNIYALNRGRCVQSQMQIISTSFMTYDLSRCNRDFKSDQWCKLLAGDPFKDNYPKNNSKGIQDLNVLAVNMGCDFDEVYLTYVKEKEFDDIIGARIFSFIYSNDSKGYNCSLLKKGQDGVLRMLEDDISRTEPIYEGLHEEITKQLKYPTAAASSGSEATVIVIATILEDGTMTGVKLYSQPGDYLLDEEALRVVNSLKKKWKPATLNGKPIKMNVVIPIRFQKQ